MFSKAQERAGLLRGAQDSMTVSDRNVFDQLPPMPTPDREAMLWESIVGAQASKDRLPRLGQHP